mmetsp:Transcript_531/g.1756  ORF Transcript_531/g.1756 Transcript_531/m.1756 type:complete len:143 (+) Transcript_531:124-552(+)
MCERCSPRPTIHSMAPTAPLESWQRIGSAGVSNGHILDLLNRCYEKQKRLVRCASRWKEWQMDRWSCGRPEWELYCCCASVVCPLEEARLRAVCPAPEAGAAAAVPGEALPLWEAMRRCLTKQGLRLRWNGERDCRSTCSAY